MLISILDGLFEKHLNQLYREIETYQNEKTIWTIEKDISNSGGNLCLHLIGNLNHFIGHVLGGTGYQRNREAEFSLKDVPKHELLQGIVETKQMISTTLAAIDEQQLSETYPLKVLSETTSVAYMLTHLCTHLGYHLGQINYHRRLLDSH